MVDLSYYRGKNGQYRQRKRDEGARNVCYTVLESPQAILIQSSTVCERLPAVLSWFHIELEECGSVSGVEYGLYGLRGLAVGIESSS